MATDRPLHSQGVVKQLIIQAMRPEVAVTYTPLRLILPMQYIEKLRSYDT